MSHKASGGHEPVYTPGVFYFYLSIHGRTLEEEEFVPRGCVEFEGFVLSNLVIAMRVEGLIKSCAT